MRIKRRLLAALAAMAIVANQSLLLIYAEETTTSESMSESTTTPISAESTGDTTETTITSLTEDKPDASTVDTTTNSTETSATSESPSETTETSTDEVHPQAPVLEFGIDNEWQWEKNTDGWILNYDETSSSVYYKVSKDWFEVDNDYLAADANEWRGFDNLEEGSYYIAFWAVDQGDNTLVTVSDVKHYQLDRTAPTPFEIESSVEKQGRYNYLVVSSKNPVSDNESGIQGIYYTVNADQRPVEQQWTAIQYEEQNGLVDIYFTLDSSFEDAAIEVYVVDNAGWKTTASLNVSNHDHQSPEITKVSIVSPNYSDEDVQKEYPNWTVLEPHEYGHEKIETNPVTNYIYASDESYLKIEVNDDRYDLQFLLVINKKEATYLADDLINVEGDYSTNGTYYIPLNSYDFGLSQGDVFSISVKASDSQNTSNDFQIENSIYYDPKDTSDSLISSSLSGSYVTKNSSGKYLNPGLDEKYDAYFRNPGENQNIASISISDDVGLASYSISVNGSVFLSESNLEEGIETEGSYTTKVTDEEGNVSTETTTVTYKDKTKVPTKENPCKIFLSDEGEYKVVIIVTDIAGNTNEIEYLYFVDTKAPTIGSNGDGSFTYTVNPDILQYFTFGIYGHETVTLSVQINDGGNKGSGINPELVKLYWAPEISTGTLTEYNVSRIDGANFIFDELQISEGRLLTATPFIIVSDYIGNKSIYYFTTESGTLNRIDAEELEKAILVLETFPPEFSITPNGSNYKVIDNRLYFGNQDDSKITFDFSDNTGIDRYKVDIQNQSIIESIETCLSNGDAPILEDSIEIDISVLDTGEYPLNVFVRDLTGYEVVDANSTGFDTTKFYVDKTAPVVSDIKYSVQSSMLRYFTFGIFGNETISISVNLSDNEFGSGIDNATLWWGKTMSLTGHGDGEYIFEGLSPDAEFTPYITVTDKMGNESIYYFTTVESGSEESSIGNLILNGNTSGITLMLEDNIDAPSISVPDGYNVNGETWYPSGIEYTVSITDEDSGLNKVVVTENERTTTEDGIRGGDKFITNRYMTEAVFSYQITDANHYDISAIAYDNAGNESEPATKTIHIDLENPSITRFEFGGLDGNGSAGPKITTYGYFFQQDTEARVYVDDPGISSGVRSVQLWLEGVEDSSYSGDTTVNSSNQDPNQPSYYNASEGYAKFTIPMGFKGRVYAEVVDNVEHTSGVINADGNIIEDAEIHARTASIDIDPQIEINHTDVAQIPLSNTSIPLTITVKDTFSGISTIEWSIANDNESGVISVSPNGEISGNGVAIGNTETDSNLVTSIQFALSVDDNSNGNIVKVVLTDRSGNISEESKTYSIDTTAPRISASIENGTVRNGGYYDSDLTVKISITERNFNGGDVQITLNGNTQTVQWNDDGSAVGQDGTVYSASFPINGDGDYTYSVSYTDRAGNPGNTVTSNQFTIDKTPPEATIVFDVGDDEKEDVYYKTVRTATFSVKEHNYGSAVIKITKDGKEISYNQDNWNHSGDTHTQSITLREESGYYQVSITVTDKAGNTFETSSKKFYIDLAAPEVHINVENVKNGAPSNEKTITPSISIVDHEGNLDPTSISLKVTVVKLTDENEIRSFTVLDYHGLSEWEKGDGSIQLDDESKPNEITFNMNNLKDDGIYTITVSATDLAGNTGGQSSEDKQNGSEYKLSVNRLGSTYEVDDKIASVEPELRYYQNTKSVPFAFSITEYNVNTLNPTETIVKITCDGNVVENQIKATEATGDNTWSVYTYEFPAELFENSGKYIIKLYSVDAAGNENPLEIDGDDERATVTFFIDNISPEVYFRDADDKTEFTNEDPYRTDLKHIEVDVYDNSMQEVQDVVFKLNGEPLNPDHEPESTIYTFDIPSQTSLQNLSMTLKDIAGNETDTGVDNFLITTNFFILWFNNTPLFIISIIGIVTIIGGLIVLLVRKWRSH